MAPSIATTRHLPLLPMQTPPNPVSTAQLSQYYSVDLAKSNKNPGSNALLRRPRKVHRLQMSLPSLSRNRKI